MSVMKNRLAAVLGTLLLTVSLARADEPPAIPALRLDNTVYAAALPLAEALGLKLTWRYGGSAAYLQADKSWLTVTAGSPLAAAPDGWTLLPTCPVKHLDALFLPVEPVVTRLGGAVQADGERLTVTLGDAKVVLTAPLEPPPPAGIERLKADLEDPRVPVRELRGSAELMGGLRGALNVANDVVGPITPILEAIAKSRVLALAKHVPVVGAFVGTAQDALGAAGEIGDLMHQLATFDDEQGKPIREAIEAAAKIADLPDLEAAAKVRATWQAAGPAFDDRLALLDKAKTRLIEYNLLLGLLDLKLKDLDANGWAKHLPVPLTLAPARRALTDLKFHVDAERWRCNAQKAYFQRLVDDTPAP
jgi:hypothetical protein